MDGFRKSWPSVSLAKSSSQGNTTCTSMKMFSAIQIQIQTRLLTPTKNEKNIWPKYSYLDFEKHSPDCEKHLPL